MNRYSLHCDWKEGGKDRSRMTEKTVLQHSRSICIETFERSWLYHHTGQPYPVFTWPAIRLLLIERNHFYFKISLSELDHSEMEFQETYRQRFIKGFYIGFFQGTAQTAFTYRYYPHIFHPSDFKGISQGSRRKVRSDTVIWGFLTRSFASLPDYTLSKKGGYFKLFISLFL